ncbi:MAG: crossover junction endodeoxyribonuclease RuvC [Chloroflexota bacterium]
MRILGIDPGTIHLGYGVIEADGAGMRMVACGAVNLSARMAIEQRLAELHKELGKVIVKHKPDEVAVEEPFVHENVRTALAIGRAEAVALLAAAGKGLPVFRYPPALVKQRVTSFGGADKSRVQQMVRILLGMKSLPEPADASDALAIAICHVKEQRLQKLGAGRASARLERAKLSRRSIGLAMARRQGKK